MEKLTFLSDKGEKKKERVRETKMEKERREIVRKRQIDNVRVKEGDIDGQTETENICDIEKDIDTDKNSKSYRQRGKDKETDDQKDLYKF